MMTCEDLGMPFHKTNYKYGNLFITFKIKFPDSIPNNQLSAITSVLSGQKKSSTEQSELNACSEKVVL
jgi:DnaJ-class molecular chaperone